MSSATTSAEPGCTIPTPAQLRRDRTSVKWTRYPADVLPLFVAEMDFEVAAEVRETLIERVNASDFGYIGDAGPLAPAFADFARDRWGWDVDPAHVHVTTDVSVGIVETFRHVLPAAGGRIAVTTPVYPSFFEMLEELPIEIVEIPLAQPVGAEPGAVRLDLAALERSAAGADGLGGLDGILLCNPHNPHGLLHTADELTALAELATRHNVFVISDEIHAPLTHPGETFIPFAPIAARAATPSITVTSASKGWNLAGTKCSVMVASDEASDAVIRALPPEVPFRASILGLHANTAAFRDARGWLDSTIDQITANLDLLERLLTEHLPAARFVRPRAGYLAWVDLRAAGFGDNPHGRILSEGKVALGDGADFGAPGRGFVRINVACAPETLREAIERIARVAVGATPSPIPPGASA